MISSHLLHLALLLPFSYATDTIVGVYLVTRHGDRTSKEAPPTSLTPLGIQEAYDTGVYFRDRYVDDNDDDTEIAGISVNAVKLGQIAPSAPAGDNVLQNSAQAFLQGLYPPIAQIETLRNGEKVQTPINLQLIPVQATNQAGPILENTIWLQGASGCTNAITSSSAYTSSAEYLNLLDTTSDFYKRLDPIIKGAYSGDDQSFKNAYAIFDFLNVAMIHNASIPSDELLDDDTVLQLQALANVHEFNLAYNESDPIRAISGKTLAADIVAGLNNTITSQGKKAKVNAQFNAYSFFLSFFGLAQLPKANPDFNGIPDYASTMIFELFTKGGVDPFPKPEDLYVRFLFHNGTSNSTSEPKVYPLFGQSETELPWNAFVSEMGKFSVAWGPQWCEACGNTKGICDTATAPASTSSSSSSTGDSTSSGLGGVSKAVAGLIGAMVTLAVILGIAALVILVGGMRLVSKKRLGAVGSGGLEAGNVNGKGGMSTMTMHSS